MAAARVGTMAGEEEETRGHLPDAAPEPQGTLDLGGRGRLLEKLLIEWSTEITDIELERKQRKEGRIQNSNDLTKGRWIKTMPTKWLRSESAPTRPLILR